MDRLNERIPATKVFRGRALFATLLLMGSLLPSVGWAQDYPARIVTLVVPFSAGGSNDAIARHLAESLGKLWKQTVIVENRPGGGSAVGTAYVAKSPPDGYRLLLASSSYTTNAAMRTSEQGFDPIKDLKPTSMVARGQIGIVSGTRVPIATLADLAREAKAQTIFYGTAGVGSSQHFNGELLNEAMGIQMTPIPYRGGNEALLDLAAGRIDIVVGTLGGLLPSIEGGRAKAVAVMGKTRSPAIPNAQTTAEAGYPAAYTENYWAIFVPIATADSVVRKINEGVKAVTNTPEGRQFLAKLDGEPTELSPEEVAVHVKKEIDYWTRLAKKLNITAK